MRRKSEIRQSVAVSVLLAAVLFAVPLMLASPAGRQLFSSETQPVETEPFVPGELDSATVLKVLDGDTVREMTMGEYLTGVLRAEMPASFEEEALKAQAVAARTYTLYKMITGGNHGDTADICTDSTCCQAYLSEEQALEVASVYPPWQAGVAYAAGDILAYGSNSVGDPQLYRVVQAHTSQENWLPGQGTGSLYDALGLTEEGYPLWSQPSGAHDAYQTGDIVEYN